MRSAQTTFANGLVAGRVNLGLGLLLGGEPGSAGHFLAGTGIGTLAYGASIELYVAGAHQLGETRAPKIFATAPTWCALSKQLTEPILAAQVVT